jgi:hypothetical protein
MQLFHRSPHGRNGCSLDRDLLARGTRGGIETDRPDSELPVYIEHLRAPVVLTCESEAQGDSIAVSKR